MYGAERLAELVASRPSSTRRRSSCAWCTRRSPPGPAASPTTPWRWRCAAGRRLRLNCLREHPPAWHRGGRALSPRMSSAYARAGVDQSRAGAAVRALVGVLAGIDTGRPSRAALGSGHYANVLRLDDRRGLALSCDGVGTKVIVCEAARPLRHGGHRLHRDERQRRDLRGRRPDRPARLHRRRGGRPRGARADRRGAAPRRRAGRRRDPRRRAGGAARADPRPPLAARLRPGRLLRRAGGPRRRDHRRRASSPATRDRPPVERHPLERADARARLRPDERRRAGRRRGERCSSRRSSTCGRSASCSSRASTCAGSRTSPARASSTCSASRPRWATGSTPLPVPPACSP